MPSDAGAQRGMVHRPANGEGATQEEDEEDKNEFASVRPDVSSTGDDSVDDESAEGTSSCWSAPTTLISSLNTSTPSQPSGGTSLVSGMPQCSSLSSSLSGDATVAWPG